MTRTNKLKDVINRIRSTKGRNIPKNININEINSIPTTNPKAYLSAIRSASNIPRMAILGTDILFAFFVFVFVIFYLLY